MGCVLTALGGCGTQRPADLPAAVQESAQVAPSADPTGAAGRSAGTISLPPPGAAFDYQLGGAYPPAPGTRVVVRDRADPPASGLYNVCYVNAFQTQPQEGDWWRAQHPDLLVRDAAGQPVQDPDWTGELLLDTTTADKRSRLVAIVGRWIDGCARAGFLAVEADNLDSWTRSDGTLGRDGNLAFARLLSGRTHSAGMAFAQKNTPELAAQGRSSGFDFALAEECHAYDECDAYRAAYGQRVLDVEYTDNGGIDDFRSACAVDGTRLSMLLRDRDLAAPGKPGHVLEVC